MKRRQFLRHTSCAAIGTTTLFSSMINMKAVAAAAASNSSIITGNDYKAIVCVLLGGGNDSYNMLLPREGTAYNEYKAARSNNAIDNATMLPLNVQNGDGRAFGLHPSMPHLAKMFNDGRASFITNIGTLVEPTTTDQFYLGSKQLPLGLYSHSDQVKQWQTALPQDRSNKGWVGKMGELIGDMNNNKKLSLNVSLSGTNFIQTGENSVAYTMVPGEGPTGLYEYEDPWEHVQLRNQAVRNIVEAQYNDAFEQTYVNTFKNSLDAFEQYKAAFDQTTGTLDMIGFSEDKWRFGQSMKTIADTIVSRTILDQQRQSFFVEFGDWDHHDELLMNHATQLQALDQGLKSFYDALDVLGLSDQVTTFVISEFGRPLVSNGNGTDHAWGGNVFVVGDAVKGQQIFGRYPNLSLGDQQDIGGGIFLPDTSCDEYFAELAMWFGVTPSDLPTILPNIGNFYDVTSGQQPIGFMK